MRVTLVIYSLSSGGAERVMSIMANYWAEKGWRITLLTFDDGSEPPFYDLHPAILRRPLGIAGHSATSIQGVVNNLKRLRVLRRTIRESDPQAVLSFLTATNILTIMSTLWLPIPVIVSERTSLTHQRAGKAWKFLRYWIYPRTTCLVVQTHDALAYFSAAVRRKAHVIPNPVTVPPDLPAEQFAGPRTTHRQTQTGGGKVRSKRRSKTVIAMGRLSQEKGFDRLLKAFAEISHKHPAWSVAVWGEGSLRSKLEAVRDELGLKGRVFFPGLTREPFEEMRKADLFVLSSRYEGFPNALCEAMACGLPVVSFDCPSGPRAIIRDGIDGILVPPGDERALAATMDRLMDDVSERERLAARAPEVVERFGVEKVMGMWETVLHDAIKRSGAKSHRG